MSDGSEQTKYITAPLSVPAIAAAVAAAWGVLRTINSSLFSSKWWPLVLAAILCGVAAFLEKPDKPVTEVIQGQPAPTPQEIKHALTTWQKACIALATYAFINTITVTATALGVVNDVVVSNLQTPGTIPPNQSQPPIQSPTP